MPLPRRRFLGGLGAVGGTALVLSGPAAAAQSGQRPAAGGRWRDFTVTQSLRGEPVTILSRARHAGAVSSLRYRGFEYADAADHGRLMQGAIAFNNRYECDNPTQAGRSRDRLNLAQRSSSRRLEAWLYPDGFGTATRMAYWKRPGTDCEIPGQGSSPADNRTRLSDVTYRWRHRFEPDGAAGLIRCDINYELGFARASAVVEALTIHTPTVFDTIWFLDRATGALGGQAGLEAREDPRPLLLATADGAHAIGFVSRTPGALYVGWRLPTNSKISLVFRPPGAVSGIIAADALWSVGTLDEVRAALTGGG